MRRESDRSKNKTDSLRERGARNVGQFGHRQSHHPRITRDIGNSTIKKDRARRLAGDVIGAHFPTQHEFGETSGIDPRQGVAPDRNLVLNHATPGFDGSAEARMLERVNQSAFP